MSKLAWIGAAALAVFAAQPASALTMQSLTAPGGGPQFVDPDEKSPFDSFYANGTRVNAGSEGSGGSVWVPPDVTPRERFNPYVTTPQEYSSKPDIQDRPTTSR